VTLIWQDRREFGRTSYPKSSMSSSIGEGSPTVARHASSTWTWQVAHAQAPPHSASMPGMAFLIAVSMTVEPISPSTVRAVPWKSI
jgi:hypothetical protein